MNARKLLPAVLKSAFPEPTPHRHTQISQKMDRINPGDPVSDDRVCASHSEYLGDSAISRKLLDALQDIASAQFAHERVNHTLQPTALVNELWLRILRSEEEPPINIRAFRVWAAKAVRNILISHARRKNAIKRGGDRVQVELHADHGAIQNPELQLLDLEEELLLLEKHDARAARVVELRFFGGMSHQEIAEELGISERLSQKSWALARSWLSVRLREH